jgi:REP-associated tyrosine transposase
MSTPPHRTAPRASYFVTTKCWGGRRILQVPEIADILIRTIFDYRERKVYSLHEFVVMPDHLHLLLTPGPTSSLEKCIQLVKGGSSHQIHKERNQKMEIWQEGFYDWTIRDGEDWRTKVEYIRLNPVRANLVEKPQDWPYSSASGKFQPDPMPDRYLKVTSGAKAPFLCTQTPGLKPRPPKEGTTPESKDRSTDNALSKAAGS